MGKTNHHNISTSDIKTMIVGSYAWLTAVSFGFVLLDIVYAGLVPDASAALREAADFLLFINALTILAAIGAIGSALDTKTARYYIAASLVIIIVGFLINTILSPVLGDGSNWGPVIRILLTGSVSLLAFMGCYRYCRESSV